MLIDRKEGENIIDNNINYVHQYVWCEDCRRNAMYVYINLICIVLGLESVLVYIYVYIYSIIYDRIIYIVFIHIYVGGENMKSFMLFNFSWAIQVVYAFVLYMQSL